MELSGMEAQSGSGRKHTQAPKRSAWSQRCPPLAAVIDAIAVLVDFIRQLGLGCNSWTCRCDVGQLDHMQAHAAAP